VRAASAGEIFLWVGLPYLALGIFVVGHVWRWRYDQFGWTSRSTQLQERRLLKWGSPVFHYGTFAAIAGHVLGILIPASVTAAIGIPENVYHWFSAIAGTVAAVLVIAGVVVLAGRRLLVPRVRATTSAVDYVALILLLIVILTGILPTVAINLIGAFGHPGGYDYRTTVSPWFRGLFSGTPDVNAIANAPVIYQVHAIASWVIWAVWPFSRLVHAWSYPLWYLWRPYIVYRSRRPAVPAEPGTSGRRWRRIGVPY
jgi:nitrate reductase gamma subunit